MTAAFSIRNQKKQLSDQKTVIGEAWIKKLFRKSPFVICAFMLVAVFLYDRSLLAYERQGILQIYEIKSQFYISLLHLKRQEVDASITPTMRHYFKNDSIEDHYLR